MNKEECFYVGYVTKTRGLKGEVQVFFEFDAYEEIPYDVLFVEINQKLVPFFIASYKLQQNQTGYFYFDDIDHIDKAQPLLKKAVYVANALKPVRGEDEFYYEDLIGYEVIEATAGALGKILNVQEFPQQHVATLLYQDQEILFPLNDDFITEIDEAEKVLNISLPEGLLEVYLSK